MRTERLHARLAPAGCLAALALVAAPLTLALEGTIVDPDGAPVSGARICYIVGTAEQVCSQSDEAGYFNLPDSHLDRMRIVASGYIPRIVAAVHAAEPWALERAAALRVRLRDARTGEAVGDGEVHVLYASGRQAGPFPANLAGLRVRTLAPGAVRIFANAPGYARSETGEATLVAGEESEITLELRAAEVQPPAESSPDE